MILANITFGARGDHEPDELVDMVQGYLANLLKSGQVCGHYYPVWTHGLLNAYVILAGLSATKPRYHSAHGKKDLQQLVKTFGAKPVWRVLDDNAGHRPSTWVGSPFLYLFTNAFDFDSPVCRSDGKPPVPVYLLPLSDKLKGELYHWQRSYYHHDHIWVESRTLEIGAYREMADPASQLAQQGRQLCREIEGATRVPTFYYLARYYCRIRGEENRLCPACGHTWKIEVHQESPKFWHFEFKCEPCRLVSHRGNSTDGGRHTKIGEYQKSTT